MTRRLLLSALLALASCSGEPPPPQIAVTDAWARPTVAGQTSAAAYVTIANQGGPDRLMGVASNAAQEAALHTTLSEDGVSRMRPAEFVEIPADGTVKLAPGGTHIMLTGLAKPLVAGEAIELRLIFERSGEKRARATILNAAAAGPHGGH